LDTTLLVARPNGGPHKLTSCTATISSMAGSLGGAASHRTAH